MVTLVEAFEESVSLAKESGERGDYYMGAVLLDPDGEIILRATNDVATNEPHGVQAEVHLLHDYFSAKKAGKDLPNLKDCTVVTIGEPAVAAPQLIEAGVGKVHYALKDGFSGLTNPELWPRSQQAQVARTFHQLEGLSEERLAEEQAAMDQVRGQVGARKKALAKEINTEWPKDYDASPDTARAIVRQQNSNAFDMRAEFEDDFSMRATNRDSDNVRLLNLLADVARTTGEKGNEVNAALVCDKAGNFLAVFCDQSAENPLQTPIMRAVDWAHEMGVKTKMQGVPDATEKEKLPIPHASDLVFISLKEPSMMELTRLSQPGNRSTIFVHADLEKGMSTLRKDETLPGLYQMKGSADALKSAGRMCGILVSQQLIVLGGRQQG